MCLLDILHGVNIHIYVLVFQLVASCVTGIQAWLLQSDAVVIVGEFSSAYLCIYVCVYIDYNSKQAHIYIYMN